MNVVRAVLLSLLTVGGMIAGVTLAAGVTVPDGDVPSEQVRAMSQQAGPSEETNSTLGSKISAFMQSNAAQTDGAVEVGMWVAAFETASNQSVRSKLVRQQTDRIRQRLEDIEAEKQRLIEQRRAGEMSQIEYESRMSNVIGSYLSLTEAIDTTEPLAEKTGTNGPEIAELRRNSENFADQEVAEVARNIGGVRSSELANRTGRSPGENRRNGNGPKTDVPGNASPATGSDGVENATDAAVENLTNSANATNATIESLDSVADARSNPSNGTNLSVGPPDGNETEGTGNGNGDGRERGTNAWTTALDDSTVTGATENATDETEVSTETTANTTTTTA